MSNPSNIYGRFSRIFQNILSSIQNDDKCLNGDVFVLLYLLSFDNLKKAEVWNPLEHHLIVLNHMIQISRKEGLNILIGGAISILHDIAPQKKIRKADIYTESIENKKNILKKQSRKNRLLHMRKGSSIAHKKLLLLNEFIGKKIFKDNDIEEICNVIKIHDYPSIGDPIPDTNQMALCFREADRLWMLSKDGFKHDLLMDYKNKNSSNSNSINNEMASNRLKHIINRFREERKLYSTHKDHFISEDLFFRTEIGYEIFKNYLAERRTE